MIEMTITLKDLLRGEILEGEENEVLSELKERVEYYKEQGYSIITESNEDYDYIIKEGEHKVKVKFDFNKLRQLHEDLATDIYYRIKIKNTNAYLKGGAGKTCKWGIKSDAIWFPTLKEAEDFCKGYFKNFKNYEIESFI